MVKAKHSKRKCLKCKWHGTGVGYPVKVGNQHVMVHCNYSGYHETTTLRSIGGKVVDLRGEDRLNCLLFEEGTPATKKNDHGGSICR